jgi:hypothetical protein
MHCKAPGLHDKLPGPMNLLRTMGVTRLRFQIRAVFISMLLAAGLARASVVDTFVFTTNGTPYWGAVDFNGDGTNDISFSQLILSIEGWPPSSVFSMQLFVSGNFSNEVLTLNSNMVVPLHPGMIISPDPTVGSWGPSWWVPPPPAEMTNGPPVFTGSNGGLPSEGLCTQGQDGYMGVKFLIGPDWHYGWIRFGFGSNVQSTLPGVMEFAYETTPNTPIVVPWPSASPIGLKGQASFNLAALSQSSYYTDTGLKTNGTGGVATALQSGLNKTVINSPFVIQLLTNSFATNFPAGAKLLMNCGADPWFFVVDSRGNVLLNVSSVLSITAGSSVNSGSELIPNGTTTASDTEKFTVTATLSYNDLALPVADGNHSNFQLSGLLLRTRTSDSARGNFHDVIMFQGAGTGIIRGGPNAIVNGVVRATVAGRL